MRIALASLTLVTLSSSALAGEVRPRGGVGGSILAHLPGPSWGPGFNARAGAQISPKFGVYGEFGALAGIGVRASADDQSASGSVSAVAYYYVSPMAEYDIDNLFVAGGPVLGFGGWTGVKGSATADGTSTTEVYAVGPRPLGIQGRVGFIAGNKRDNGALRGFQMALDLKLLNGGITSVEATAGQDVAEGTVEVGNRAFALTPQLVIGYEWR